MVSRRSSPGSSSTTRMRALRLPVWFKVVSLTCGDGSALARRRRRGLALIQRALDVGDGVELGARLLELLAQARVLVHLLLQAVVHVRDQRMILLDRLGL